MIRTRNKNLGYIPAVSVDGYKANCWCYYFNCDGVEMVTLRGAQYNMLHKASTYASFYEKRVIRYLKWFRPELTGWLAVQTGNKITKELITRWGEGNHSTINAVERMLIYVFIQKPEWDKEGV